MAGSINAEQWQRFEQQGWLMLGKLLSETELTSLQRRIDEIMLGKAKVAYGRLLMQLDSTSGRYEEAGDQSKGHKGATLAYRKIQDLEFDPLFLAYLRRPIFREICERIYGRDVPVACFRAMFMNKPAKQGTMLPWHQDRWTHLDRDPLITLWTALDPATRANGCLQVIPGGHRHLINPEHPSGFLTPEQAQRQCPDERVAHLELKAGEVVLLHNWLPHRSDVNHTDKPRRALSVCYMDGRTRVSSEERYPVVFGAGGMEVDSALPVNG